MPRRCKRGPWVQAHAPASAGIERHDHAQRHTERVSNNNHNSNQWIRSRSESNLGPAKLPPAVTLTVTAWLGLSNGGSPDEQIITPTLPSPASGPCVSKANTLRAPHGSARAGVRLMVRHDLFITSVVCPKCGQGGAVKLEASVLPVYQCGQWSTTYTRLSPGLRLGPKATILCALCEVEVTLGGRALQSNSIDRT